MNHDDNAPDAPADQLHEQALQHLGRRLFAEARQQSESDDAEFEARQRARRKLRDKEPDLSAASTIAGGSEAPE